ncbi:hypothetical protein D3C71_2085690 [compost metagenome]
MSWLALRVTEFAVTRVSAMPSSRMLPCVDVSATLLPARMLPSFRVWSPLKMNWFSNEL